MKTYPCFTRRVFVLSMACLIISAIHPIAGASVSLGGGMELTGQIGGQCNDVVIAGDYAYAAEGRSLTIWDITSLETPTLVSKVSLPGAQKGTFFDVKAAGNTVCAAWAEHFGIHSIQGPGGFFLLDVSNPLAPQTLATHETPEAPRAVALAENMIYFIREPDGGGLETALLEIYGIGGGIILPPRGTLDIPFAVAAACCANDYLYVAGRTLRIIDVSDPDAPQARGTMASYELWYDVAVQGQTAYMPGGAMIMEGSYLGIVDVSNPDSFSSNVVVLDSFAAVSGVSIAGDRAYVSSLTDEFYEVDLAAAGGPEVIQEGETPGRANAVAFDGARVLVAAQDAGLLAIDPNAKDLAVARGLSLGAPEYVALDGDFAYAATPTGMFVLDVSNLLQPAYVGHYHSDDAAHHVEVAGNRAYLAAGTAGLQVLDITDRANPAFIGAFDPEEEVWTSALKDGTAFVTTEADASPTGLEVVGLSDEANPVAVAPSTAMSFDGAREISLQGAILAISPRDDAFTTLDISTPAAPAHVADVYSSVPAAMSGNIVYGTQGASIETRRLEADGLLTSLNAGFLIAATPEHLAIANGTAFVLTESDGLTLVDFTRPGAPAAPGGTSGLLRENYFLAARDDAAYVVGQDGLSIIRNTAPFQCGLFSVFSDEGQSLASMAVSLGIDANGDGFVTSDDTAWEDWDLDRDGIPDRYQLALLAEILCSSNSSYRLGASLAFNGNNADFAIDDEVMAGAFPAVIGALLTLSAQAHATLYGAGVVGDGVPPYGPYRGEAKDPGEPLAGDADFDGDGFTNREEYENCMASGGSIEDFVFAATTPWSHGGALPAAHPAACLGGVLLVIAFAVKRFSRQGRPC